MTDIEKDLRELIRRKQGNKEMALFFDPDDNSWHLLLGNPSNAVQLGEVGGELETEGKTLDSVIKKMTEYL